MRGTGSRPDSEHIDPTNGHSMNKPHELKTVSSATGRTGAGARFELDLKAIEAAKNNIADGAVTPGHGQDSEAIVKLLDGALATEIVCTLRYKRHYFTAHGLASPSIAEEFLAHANEEQAHADSIARRIVQLGGAPDLSPDSLSSRSHADYDASTDLKSMLRADLTAERVAIESYHQMINLIGDRDPTTRRMLEGILAQEEEHADELKDMLQE
jgi:bacterioferritin